MISLLGFSFHLYGLMIGLGIWTAYEASLRLAVKKKIDTKMVDGMVLWVVILGIIGARVYHVIDLWNEVYMYSPIEVFYLWKGGLGIWGAIIGGVLGMVIYYWKMRLKMELVELFDLMFFGVPLAQAIGRWGNFFNNELYGRVTSLPWGISIAGSEFRYHPLFLYESILNLVLFGVLVRLVSQREKGLIRGVYLFGYGLIRFLLEPMRPEEVVWKLGVVPVAQIMALISIVVGFGVIRTVLKRS